MVSYLRLENCFGFFVPIQAIIRNSPKLVAKFDEKLFVVFRSLRVLSFPPWGPMRPLAWPSEYYWKVRRSSRHSRAATRPIHHTTTGGAPRGHAGFNRARDLIPVRRGRAGHLVRVGLDQPRSIAARASSHGKGGSEVEFFCEQEARSGATGWAPSNHGSATSSGARKGCGK